MCMTNAGALAASSLFGQSVLLAGSLFLYSFTCSIMAMSMRPLRSDVEALHVLCIHVCAVAVAYSHPRCYRYSDRDDESSAANHAPIARSLLT